MGLALSSEDSNPTQMMHMQAEVISISLKFPHGRPNGFVPTGTKRSACAAVIEGTRLETKKMTADKQ